MIIVFGSVNMDMVVKVDALPRQGETVLCPGYTTIPGGKGANQAIAAARAGAKTAMVGMVGDDGFGRRCFQNLKEQGVMASGIGKSDKPTGCAYIAVDPSGQNTIISASGANLDTAEDQVPDEILTGENTILMQMEIPLEQNWKMVKRAHDRGCRTILNAAPVRNIPRDMLGMIRYLIINEIEARQLAQKEGIDANDGAAIAKALSDASKMTCIVTLGREGTVAASKGDIWKVGVLDITAVDTTGAGDTFCGVFAAAKDAGADLPEALHRAAVAGGLACLKLGAQGGMPFREDIDERLGDLPAPQKIS